MIKLSGIHTARMHDYYGLWAVEPLRFNHMFKSAQAMDLFAHVASSQAPKMDAAHETVGRSDTTKGVAVIPIQGTMMKHQSSMDAGCSTVIARMQIRDAMSNPDIGAIMIVFDTPGGSVAGTAALAADINAAKAVMPVYAQVEDLCASAGVWCASQCDKIFVNHGTAGYGSIGVFMGIYDMSKAADKEGIEAVVFSTGPLKAAGFPGTEITDAQRDHWQASVNETHAFFVKAVMEGRNMTAAQVKEVATGGVFSALDAIDNGLVDGIQSFDSTLNQLLQEANQSTDDNKSSKEIVMNADEQKLADEAKAADEAKVKADAAAAKKIEDDAAPTPSVDAGDGAKFLAVFGDIGGKYFAEGKSFEDALVAHVATLNAKVSELTKANAGLAERLANVKIGDDGEGLSGGEGNDESGKRPQRNGAAAAIEAAIRIS